MQINEVGESRKIVIPSGEWSCLTIDENLKGAIGVIVTSGSPYELFGVLTSGKKPEVAEACSIRINKGQPTVFLEIGPKVELWMKHASNTSEAVYVQEFK